MATRKYEIEELKAHFPNEVTDEVVDYARDTVFLSSRYIFTHRKGKQQYGYCTHCNTEFETKGLRHKKQAVCPKCNSKCTVVASGYGRSTMIDERYFVYYDKSLIDKDAIVARGIYAIRDYRGNYKTVETHFKVVSMYVFKPGISMAIRRSVYYSESYGMCRVGEWEKCASIYSESSKDHFSYIDSYCSNWSIKKAVQNTPFAWSGYKLFLKERTHYRTQEDMVKFFDLYARYPCVEYLNKLGFSNLVRDKLDAQRTYNAINWRGKNLFKVLKITKQELKTIKEENIRISFKLLKLYQVSRNDSSKMTLREIARIADNHEYYYNDLIAVAKHSNLRKAINYIDKQYKKFGEHYYSKSYTLSDWRDYIDDCKTLELNLQDDVVLFPKNLYEAHQDSIKKVKYKASEELNKKIQARSKALEKKYKFDYQGLLIRPANSAKEIIDEGDALKHCVGRSFYIERHAKGNIAILFIRKCAKPNKPYFTVEIRDNEIVQIRGLKNCNPDSKVKKFIEVFKDEKLNKKAKNRITIPA